MLLEKRTLDLLQKVLPKLEEGFSLPAVTSPGEADYQKMEQVLTELAIRLQDNYPYFHPLYAGQMLKPPHPIARAAYMLAMWINPNNHALDGSRASSPMEKEAVGQIARMFGWSTHLGHLTGGGTMANLEALWVAGRLDPGKWILGSELAHYTHERISQALGLKFQKVKALPTGKMDLADLEGLLAEREVGTVVATMGTTGLGTVDPLPELLELRKKYGFRLHADAAYGGYFILADNLENETAATFQALSAVDSIVIDPHKHGLQPYGCGCVLFKDPNIAGLYLHDSPYTYYTSDEIHLGEISLECSRAGASAVGLWATLQMLPLEKGGEFARGLSLSRSAAMAFYQRLAADNRFWTIIPPELDIVVWAFRGPDTRSISEKARLFFRLAEARQLYLSLFQYPVSKLDKIPGGPEVNTEAITCLRACLMKPEHLDWLDELWDRLMKTMDQIEIQISGAGTAAVQ